jgi:hypothetical protein
MVAPSCTNDLGVDDASFPLTLSLSPRGEGITLPASMKILVVGLVIAACDRRAGTASFLLPGGEG